MREPSLLLLAALPALAALAFVLWPLPPELLARRRGASVQFTDRNGRLLREVSRDGDGPGSRLPAGAPIPPLVRQAFIAAEDRRFESHLGVDPLAVARAAWQDLRARRVVSGASTITEQLARQLVPRPRTAVGKVREALWALRLTAHLPREEILRAYLDRVPLGRDLVGVEAAAEGYFGRPAAALSAGQAALLAGMARAPARCDPRQHLGRASARMAAVLERMRRLGFLGAEAARVAAGAPLDLVAPARPFEAPHFTDRLARDLPSLGLAPAASVETTLDASLQADAEELLRGELSAERVDQAAAIVLDNATGDVLAYVGSADFFDEERLGQNDGVRAMRQPGSALKPFAYGLALASGYTPASLLSDVEVEFATPAGAYVPRNYDRRVHGPVRLRAALANSYNVPAVKLAEALGEDRVLGVLRGAGFESLDRDASHYGVGIVLGNGDVTLYELARGYRGLARGGVLEPLREVRSARDASGRALPMPAEIARRRFLPAPAVALLTDILSDEAARAPAFGLDNALRLPFRVAAKTGTSRAYVDNWTAGFTAERTVAVWAGHFDGRPMRGVSGISGAGPIFRRLMLRAMRGLTPRPLVERARFERARVCALSGELAGPSCPSTLEEVFLPGTIHHSQCSMHRRLARRGGEAVLDVGPAYYAWAHAEGLDAGPWFEGNRQPPPPRGEGREGDGEARDREAAREVEEARIVVPGDGDEYLLEAGLPAGAQAIPVQVRVPASTRRIEVRSDDGTVLSLEPPFVGRIPARPGRHRVEVRVRGQAAPLASAVYVVHGGGAE